MVVLREDMVKCLENLFQICLKQEKTLLSNGLAQNDVRVTFFKHLNNTLDASIHFMILLDKHFRKPHDFKTWKKIMKTIISKSENGGQMLTKTMS